MKRTNQSTLKAFFPPLVTDEQRAVDKSEEANKLLLEKRRRAAVKVAKRAGKTPNSRGKPRAPGIISDADEEHVFRVLEVEHF
jgi:hypothetical protein